MVKGFSKTVKHSGTFFKRTARCALIHLHRLADRLVLEFNPLVDKEDHGKKVTIIHKAVLCLIVRFVNIMFTSLSSVADLRIATKLWCKQSFIRS